MNSAQYDFGKFRGPHLDPTNASMLFCSAWTKVKGLAPKDGKAPASGVEFLTARSCHVFLMRFRISKGL